MERILILMQAANWAEATEALTSARENALMPRCIRRTGIRYAPGLRVSRTSSGMYSANSDGPSQRPEPL